MSLEPFITAPIHIQLHAAAATLAVVIGPGFALLTFWSLWRAITSVKRGDIRTHELTLRSLYWFGLIAAGLANFLPDRRTNEAIFGGQDHLGFIVIGIGVAAIIFRTFVARKSQPRSPTALLTYPIR